MPTATIRTGAWLLVPILAVWLLLARPVNDFDIFWQLRLGDLMLDTGRLVTREPFAASHLGEPLVPMSALAQVILAGARRLAGWRAVQAIDALCWVGGFLAVGFAARQRGAAAAGLGIALAVCITLALPFSGLRPQSMAVLCFGLLILLREQDWPLQRLLPCAAVLLVLWQNLHPSVSIAVVWLGARAGTGLLLRLLGRRAGLPWTDGLIAVLAALAMFATPGGSEILSVSLNNAAMSAYMGATEWLSPFDPGSRPFLPQLLVLNGLVLALLVWRWRTMRLEDAAAALVFLLLGMVTARFLLFWALAVVLPAAGRDEGEVAPAPREWLLFPAGFLIALIAAAARGPVAMPADYPGNGLAALRASGVRGPIYATFAFGGAAIDAGWQVALDGRYYRYSREEWALVKELRDGRVDLPALQARFRPAAWLVQKSVEPALVEALRADPAHWREVQSDGLSATFVPAR